MSDTAHQQTEPEHISTSLYVETLDDNIFRSNSLLNLPIRARGVFGGQVMSQALVSATRCVEETYSLNSMHCYFLLSASPVVPIIYHVDKVRNGQTYCTRFVRATQRGRTVFVMMCSFQRPEPWQPTFQIPIPEGVPSPEECENTEVYAARVLEGPVKPAVREYLNEVIQERHKSPLIIRYAGTRPVAGGNGKTVLYWYKVKSVPECSASFQKCILSYISDSTFIGSAAKSLDIDRYQEGAKRLAMTSTLDHTMWFYSDDFDCGDWLLYVIDTTAAGSGRAVVTGRMYTTKGVLIAAMAQEGVVRVDVRGPKADQEVKAKL